jgi:serine/threonine-protein kinase
MHAQHLNSFLGALTEFGLLEAWQLAALERDVETRAAGAEGFFEDLRQRGWLTAFQVAYLLEGRALELTLGAYVLLDKLGRGGMGEVYKARHRRLDRVVALKTIRPDRLDRPELVARFQREARLTARLHHPNLVLVYDADEVNGKHFFTMEFVDGETAAQRLARSAPLPVAMACDIARQAALGLQHAHERDLVHRDVKPSNLLIATGAGAVKVLDLGLAFLSDAFAAHDAEALTSSGELMGTADYMAPEQSFDAHKIDTRADIYSLGCTLYHLLAARPPFPGGSFAQKVVRHREQTPRPVESLRTEVPTALGDVIRRLMARAPEERPNNPAAAAALLAPFCHPAIDGVGERGDRSAPVEGAKSTLAAGVAAVPASAPGSSNMSAPTPVVSSPPLSRGRSRRWVVAACAILAFVSLWYATKDLATPQPKRAPEPQPGRTEPMTWPADYPLARRAGGTGIPVDVISRGPYQPRPADPARGNKDGTDPLFQVEWHRRLCGLGRFHETSHGVVLSSGPYASPLRGCTVLALAAVPAGGFEWRLSVVSPQAMDPMPHVGLFFGWQEKGDAFTAYFARLIEPNGAGRGLAAPELRLRHLQWPKASLAPRTPALLVPSHDDGTILRVFELDRAAASYKLVVRADGRQVRLGCDQKWFPPFVPPARPDGLLGIWVQNGQATFETSTIASLPASGEDGDRPAP